MSDSASASNGSRAKGAGSDVPLLDPVELEVTIRLALNVRGRTPERAADDLPELASALGVEIAPRTAAALHRIEPILNALVTESAASRERFLADPVGAVEDALDRLETDVDPQVREVLASLREAASSIALPADKHHDVEIAPYEPADPGRAAIDLIRADHERAEAFRADPMAVLTEVLEEIGKSRE